MSLLEISSAVIALVIKSPARNINSHSRRVEKDKGDSILFQKHFVSDAVQLKEIDSRCIFRNI